MLSLNRDSCDFQVGPSFDQLLMGSAWDVLGSILASALVITIIVLWVNSLYHNYYALQDVLEASPRSLFHSHLNHRNASTQTLPAYTSFKDSPPYKSDITIPEPAKTAPPTYEVSILVDQVARGMVPSRVGSGIYM